MLGPGALRTKPAKRGCRLRARARSRRSVFVGNDARTDVTARRVDVARWELSESPRPPAFVHLLSRGYGSPSRYRSRSIPTRSARTIWSSSASMRSSAMERVFGFVHSSPMCSARWKSASSACAAARRAAPAHRAERTAEDRLVLRQRRHSPSDSAPRDAGLLASDVQAWLSDAGLK